MNEPVGWEPPPLRCVGCGEAAYPATALSSEHSDPKGCAACGGLVSHGIRVDLATPGPFRAGDRVTGEVVVHVKYPGMEGSVEIALYVRVRGAQADSDVTLHHERLRPHTGPLETVTRWPFAFTLPVGPPSHAGARVSVDWDILGVLIGSRDTRTVRSRALTVVLPTAPPPGAARIRTYNRLGRLRVRLQATFAWSVKLGISLAYLGVVPAVFFGGRPFSALGVLLFIWLPFLYYAVPFARLFLPELTAAVRSFAVPRPGPVGLLHPGQSAPVRVDPRCTWKLVLREEASSRVRSFRASTPTWVTEWDAYDETVAEGKGSGTLTLPADAAPTLTTWSRALRWELRIAYADDPGAVKTVHVEVLPWRIPN